MNLKNLIKITLTPKKGKGGDMESQGLGGTLKNIFPALMIELFSIFTIKKSIEENKGKGDGKSSTEDNPVKLFLGGLFNNSDEAGFAEAFRKLTVNQQKKLSEFINGKLEKWQQRNLRVVITLLAKSGATTKTTTDNQSKNKGKNKDKPLEEETTSRANPGVEFLEKLTDHPDDDQMLAVCKATGILDSEFNDVKETVLDFTKKIPEELESLATWMEEDMAKRRAKSLTTKIASLFGLLKGRFSHV